MNIDFYAGLVFGFILGGNFILLISGLALYKSQKKLEEREE